MLFRIDNIAIGRGKPEWGAPDHDVFIIRLGRKDLDMAKAISNKNVVNAKFKVADFTGKWLASFGKPELRGAWIIYGGERRR